MNSNLQAESSIAGLTRDYHSQHCMALERDLKDLVSGWNKHMSAYRDTVRQVQKSLRGIESRVAEMRQENRYIIDKMDVDLLTSKLASLSIDTGLLKKSRDILDSLDYGQRPVRHEAIPIAHQETCQWAFHRRQVPATENQSHARGEGDFSLWLQEKDDTFWISGKPGSGKSTLMKFIASHPETKRMLGNSQWAGSSKVVVASHYFWSTGTEIQRSQQGLWRSLLFDILRQEPRMISQVCRERCGTEEANLRHQPWSLDELLECVKALADQKDSKTRFCIFVDGLDEFEGDPLDLIKPLQALSRSHLVKLCVSSRPWNAFEEGFGQRPDLKLYVHDLTIGDIRAFTSERLMSHPRWDTFASNEDSTSIVEDIAQRSHGVFLWVFLVTRELREGLTNFDTLADLKRRLDRMPSELGPFFKHILDSVDSFYHGRMAEILRISLAANEVNDIFGMHFSLYYFHEKEYDDPGFALMKSVQPECDERAMMHMIQRVYYRLNGICKGLLELSGNCVSYIHRTVRDWLRTPAMEHYLKETSSPTFNPHQAILLAYLARIKTTRFTDPIDIRTSGFGYSWQGELTFRLREAFSYVAYAENPGHCRKQTFQVIESFGNAVEELFAVDGARFGPCSKVEEGGKNPTMMFRQHLLEARLWHYLAPKLQVDPDFFETYPVTPFSVILGDNSLRTRVVWTRTRDESLRGLLADKQMDESGCNSDRACAMRVAWTLLMHDCLPSNIIHTESTPTAEQLASFTSALKIGTMSRLAGRITASAEICVARAPLTSVPAWFGLLLLLLKVKGLQHQQKGTFLEMFQGMLESPDTDLGSLMNNTESGTTLWDVLCTHLIFHRESAGRRSHAQIQFLARILSIISTAAEKQWALTGDTVPPRGLLKSTISKCFPPSSAKPLLAILGPHKEDTVRLGDRETGKTKRRDEEDISGGSVHKRVRRLGGK